ncbi:MAG: glycerol-3-phosphate dehydrogenase/oxidase [Gluconacetobacter diazotrophicus]|nr:glycerol-3-phosphate dehydrogenase/oxidase [Gluconacetobacter diazotrophicus]
MRERLAVIEAVKARPECDVLVVGGGINGVGILRDLAAQGVSAVLAERGDIGGGSSAAPSRLIHGGLRYLETGEFALVRESVHERERLLRNAPHLVRPLPTWVPLQSWTAGGVSAVGRLLRLKRDPGRKGAVPVKLGLVFYDLFSRGTRVMPRHRFLGGRAARRVLPDLSPRVRAVAEYYDARVTHPERLCLEVAADAERAAPDAIHALPYCAAVRVDGASVVLRDVLGGEEFTVRPRVVVNAAGPWIDAVDRGFGRPDTLAGGNKGSHLVLRAPKLAGELGGRMLYFETREHRVCLVYALDADHVLLGTTDLPTENPDDRSCSPEEERYLFGVLRDAMPGAAVGPDDVVFSYAGVRPLPRSTGSVAGAVSRDHKLHRFGPEPGREMPLFTLVGGKWTTYRSCAAQVVDAVLPELGRVRVAGTERLPIGGGRDWPAGGVEAVADRLRMAGVPPNWAPVLATRYGTAAEAVWNGAAGFAGRSQALDTAPSYSAGEIAFLATRERVSRLEDVVLRRTLMGFEGLARPEVVREVGAVVGAALGWNRDRVDAEVRDTLAVLRGRHGLKDEAPGAIAA